MQSEELCEILKCAKLSKIARALKGAGYKDCKRDRLLKRAARTKFVRAAL